MTAHDRRKEIPNIENCNNSNYECYPRNCTIGQEIPSRSQQNRKILQKRISKYPCDNTSSNETNINATIFRKAKCVPLRNKIKFVNI